MQMIPLKYPERTQHPNIIVIRLSFKSVSVEAAKKPGNLDEVKWNLKFSAEYKAMNPIGTRLKILYFYTTRESMDFNSNDSDEKK